MANVVLIDVAGWQGGVGSGVPYPNIGIAYLVAALKEGNHAVTVLDLNNESLSDDQIAAALVSAEPTLVGLSVKTATFKNARRLGAFIRSFNPGLSIMVGGPHASVAASDITGEDWIDYLLIGEGELVLPELCRRLADGHGRRLDDLPGVVVCKSGTSHPGTSVARVARLDELPFPDFSGFGHGVREAVRLSYPLVTSRGCPYQCSYCSVSKISGSTVRYRSVVQAVDELSRARELYGISGFEVVDDSFNVDMTRAKEFCRLLIEHQIGMSWACPNGIRADRVDAELAGLMAQSGCRSVMVGVESVDPEVLALVKKGESIEEIEKGIRILKEAGLSVGGFFIIGLPGDSYGAQLRSVEFALRNGINAHFNMLVPYPGTEVYRWVMSNARLLDSADAGLHFADSTSSVRSVFETDDFTARQRQQAYEMAHTRLRRFDMIVPHNVSKWHRRFLIACLLLRYDSGSILPLFLDFLKSAVTGYYAEQRAKG